MYKYNTITELKFAWNEIVDNTEDALEWLQKNKNNQYLKDEYERSGEYNMNRSLNNLNYSTHSNDDMFKNILSKDELEELNDDFIFDRKHVFNKPMYHSSSMDEISSNKGSNGKNYTMSKKPMPMNPLPPNMQGIKKEDENIVPFHNNEDIQDFNNLFDKMNINETKFSQKKLRHGKSYDNLTAKKYNRQVDAPPPLPNSYVMKYDFPPPPNSPPTGRYITPSKKGSGYTDDFNFN